MNFYEHTYITTPELSKEDLDSVRKKIDEIIKKNDSKLQQNGYDCCYFKLV